MALSPEEITFYMVQAEEAYRDKDFNKAVSILNTIIKESPDYVPAYRRTGSILMLSQSQEKAQHYLKRAIELAPEDGENWKALGQYHKNRREWREARNAFSQSKKYLGDNPQLLYEIVRAELALGEWHSALTTVQSFLQTDPGNMWLLWHRALIVRKMGREEEAFALYRQLVESGRSDLSIEAVREWYELMLQYRFVKEARHILQQLSDKDPKNSALKNLYAASCSDDMDTKAAMRLLEESHKLSPDDTDTLFSLAITYRQIGDIDRSDIYMQKILENDPLSVGAIYALSASHHFSYDDVLFKKVNFLIAHMPELNHKDQSAMHYVAGKAYDDAGDYKTAFEHYKLGGALQAQNEGEKNIAVLKRQYDRAKRVMTKAFFETNLRHGYQSNKPLFIVGMPRSGTTLMEQVLSGIDGVYGAGELPYNLDILNGIEVGGHRLDFGRRKSFFPTNNNPSDADRGATLLKLMESHVPQDAKRIIDKEPNNFIWLGYLLLILPGAKFIHSRRHPVETCLSAYRIRFSSGQYWSCDLRTMGRYYRLYTEMMAHWHSVLPEGTILDVRYEDMVNDLETQSKRIAAYIDMPWSPKCLEFHTSKKPVRTASLSQVRQPLYKTSMNRWRKYEPYLKPLLDEIGDLVEAYEKELEMENSG